MAVGSKRLAANEDGPATWLPRFQAYVEELKREMRLVTWPNRAQVRSTTLVVLVTVFAFAVFFGVVDFLLASGQTALYQYFR
jgi:preprotein translocase subunit SecE